MKHISENALAIAVFIFVRAAVTAALYLMTSGEEVASDVRFHLAVMNDPLGILSGAADISIASYPPLQFLIEWPLFHFFTLFTSDFIAFRLMFVLIEFIGFLACLRLLQEADLSKGVSWVIRWGMTLGPHQILTSTVFQQEEVISQMILLIAALLVLTNRKTLAMMALAVGVLVGKIFFILPLFYLTVFYKQSLKDAWAWSLVFVVYGISVSWALSTGGNLPLVGFTPDPTYGSTFWVLIVDRYPDSLSLHKNISLMLCVLGQALTCLYFLLQSNRFRTSLNPIMLLAWPLALFFFTFYQHMPEYLLLVIPVILLYFKSFWSALVVSAILALSWIPNIFFGLKNIGIINSSKSPTRNRVLQPFVDWVGMDFAQLHVLSLVVYSALYAVALVMMWKQYTKLRTTST